MYFSSKLLKSRENKKLVDLDQQSSLTTIFVDFTSDDAEIQLKIVHLKVSPELRGHFLR